MAKASIATLSIEALISLRDQITDALSKRAGELQNQLARLTGTAPTKRGRPPGKATKRKGKLKGSKVAAKYKGPNGETWSGRGLKPRWMTAAIKAGSKQEDFAIGANVKGKKRG